MARTEQCRSLRELDELLDGLAPKSSPAMAKADRWIVAELTRAVRFDLLRSNCCRSLRNDLLDRDNIAAYFAAAEADELRTYPRRNVPLRPGNSSHTRRRVLRRFGLSLGIELEFPPATPPPRFQPVTRSQQNRVQTHVEHWADLIPPEQSRKAVYVRLAAVVGIVADTRARSGELAALTLDDFTEDLTAVRIVRRPQGGWPGREERLPLSLATRRDVARWLRLRAELTNGLAGQAHRALWVSVAPGRRHHRPGIPIRSAEVLGIQYASAVDHLNQQMRADRVPGWVDLPGTLERLRHSPDNAKSALGVDTVAAPKNPAATAA
jgi:integrase